MSQDMLALMSFETISNGRPIYEAVASALHYHEMLTQVHAGW